MRQLRTGATRSSLVFVVAAISVITLAASSPIYSAVSAGHVTGQASAAPVAAAGRATEKADCSTATARRLANQHRLNHFQLPNPIRQVLCGSFTGPGSEAMAITIGAPTCWPVQHWGVFSFTGGVWRLVLDQPAYLIPPLVAVGSGIRETTAVSRPGDSRCFPSGGTRARVWHWNGTRLTAGPWKQLTEGEPKGRGFSSPSRGIDCGMSDSSGLRAVTCQTLRPPQKVTMDARGRLTICRGSEARCKLGNAGEDVPVLAYGRQVTVGRFRCLSQRSGVTCTVIRSGKGFLINRNGVRRVRP